MSGHQTSSRSANATPFVNRAVVEAGQSRRSSGRTSEYQDAITNMMDQVMEIVTDLLPVVPEGEVKDVIGKMREQMKNLIVALMTAEYGTAAADEISEDFAAATPVGPLLQCHHILDASQKLGENIANAIEAYEKNLTDDVVGRHPKMVKFDKTIKSLLKRKGKVAPVEEEDDELDSANRSEAMEVDTDVEDWEDATPSQCIPKLDPITKKPLRDPIRNVLCSHIYGKAAMLALLQKSKNLRCPTNGCTNTAFIKADHLVEDMQLNETVRKLRKQKS